MEMGYPDSEIRADPRDPKDDAEISKKDILRETGISYGQFYRWKRMGLIPESWFRRRSTFTGQEAFLPRQKVLERIERIQELKDRLSLEEIAEMLSPSAADREYTLADVRRMGALDHLALELLPRDAEHEELRYLDLLALMLAQDLLARRLTHDQIRQSCGTLLEKSDELTDGTAERSLVVAVRDGVSICALHTGVCLFDRGVSVVASVNLNSLIEDLNLRLRSPEDQ
jgi:DNA-binding transcriptional MerR regulator